MATGILKRFIGCFIFFATTTIHAQNIQLCITVNGQPLAADKKAYLCKANALTSTSLSTIELAATNCATNPETNSTITWKNLDVPPNNDSIDNVITAASIGRWEATIKNNLTSTIRTEIVTISYFPTINVVMNDGAYKASGPEGCPLTVFNLSSTSSGPITSYNWYHYSPKVLIPGANSSSITLNKRNTYYIVEAIDANGCVAADTSTSFFNQRPTLSVNVGPDPALFCEGGTFSLVSSIPVGQVVSDYTAQWGYRNGATYTNLGSIVTLGQAPAPAVVLTPPGGTTTYWMRVSKFPYCDFLDEVVVNTTPLPVVDLGPATQLHCFGTTTTLTPVITVGKAPYTYTWTSSPTNTLPSSSSIAVSPTSNTTYFLSVTDANNCGQGSDNLVLQVNPQITISLSNDTTICLSTKDSANLKAMPTGGFGSFTHSWSPSTTNYGLSNPTGAVTKASPKVTSIYTYTATDANSCKASKLTTVTIYSPPLAKQSDPYTINEDISKTLTASTPANTGFIFSWSTDKAPSKIISTSPNLLVEYKGPDTTNYIVSVHSNFPSLPLSSLNSCYNNDTITVRSISNNTLLYVPNVFSPNAINPQNQKFRIYGDNLLNEGFKLVVYNKWGNLLFETTDLSIAKGEGWDGGAKIEGVYTYVITGKFKNGKDVSESNYYKGTFSLIL